MRLIDTEPLAQDLEQGLDKVYGVFFDTVPSLRLRRNVSTITSIALAEYLGDRGVSTQLILSRPNLDIDPDLEHALMIAHYGRESLVIDPTYTFALKYAGLTPMYVQLGGWDAYPDAKIA